MIHNFAIFVLLFIISCSSINDNKEKSTIQILSENITQNPTDIDLLYSRVEYNKSKNNLESALFDLKEIVRLDSLNKYHHNYIASIYFELSKSGNQRAEYPLLVRRHLEKSIKIDPQNPSAFALFGELLLAYNKYENAIEYFNSSLKIEYNQEKTHMLMGYAFKQLSQVDNAINCFRNAISINPDFFEAHMQLGHIFHLLGDTNALTYYNNALKIKPSDPMVLYNKALFYQSIFEWNKSLEAYSKLHNVSPFHSSGHYNLGFIHMELKLYDVATNNFSDAIYSDSDFYEAYYSRGICFENLGNIAQAESDYKRAVEINPDYSYAIEALLRLKANNNKYNN